MLLFVLLALALALALALLVASLVGLLARHLQARGGERVSTTPVAGEEATGRKKDILGKVRAWRAGSLEGGRV